MRSIQLTKEIQPLAVKYVWWETPEWACKHPYVFLANLMNLGFWEDWCLARQIFGDQFLREVLLNAPPGYFSNRSWDYWHLKLGFDKIPPLPKRKFL